MACCVAAPSGVPVVTPQTAASQSQHGTSEARSTTPAASKAKGRSSDVTYVDTTEALEAMLTQLTGAGTLAVDCEGVKLGDKSSGKLTLIQLSVRSSSSKHSTTSAASQQQALHIWLVDVLQLQAQTFYHQPPNSSKALSLKQLLEDSSLTKLLYDVRSDSAQLQREFGVRLRGTYDLQLAEVAVRQFQRFTVTFVLPLDKVLSNYLTRTPSLDEDLVLGYEISRAYHYTNKTEVWSSRPLTDELLQYAASDVRYLHQLQDILDLQLPASVIDKVKVTTAQREGNPVVALEQKAVAPLIVRRSDVNKLMRERTAAANNNSHSSSSSHTNSSASSSGQAASGSNRDSASGQAQQERGKGGKQRSRRQGDKQQHSSSADDSSSKHQAAPRAPPPKLAVPHVLTDVTRNLGLDVVITRPAAMSDPVPTPVATTAPGVSGGSLDTPVPQLELAQQAGQGVQLLGTASDSAERRAAYQQRVERLLEEQAAKVMAPAHAPADQPEEVIQQQQGQEAGSSSGQASQGQQQEGSAAKPAVIPGLLWQAPVQLAGNAANPALLRRPTLRRPRA